MNQQRAEYTTSSRLLIHPGLAAAGILSWCQLQPGGKLASVLERLRIAHTGHQRRGGDGASTFSRHQPLGRFALDRDKAHRGSSHGFADGFGIVGVVFATLAIGTDELGGHEPGLVAELD